MTYCAGILVQDGLVMIADTRTNAGLDNISTFRKMKIFENPGERVLTLMSAGNLATTQAVISLLEERTKAPDDRDPSLMAAPSMFQAARLVADVLREVIEAHAQTGQQADSAFNATMMLGGQIYGGPPRMFLIYPEGNFIEASRDTPFFQIGETKYGRPIIIRGYDPEMSMEDAVKLLMVSFDSTLKANLSVGLPLDLQVIERNGFKPKHEHRITHDDPYFQAISSSWGDALKNAFHSLPDYSFYREG